MAAPAKPDRTVRLSDVGGFVRIIASQKFNAGATEYLCVIGGKNVRVIPDAEVAR